MDLLIATGNMHKVAEIQRILSGLAVKWRTSDEWPDATEPDEIGATYEENALIKARAWSSRTGLWTIADDSGLEVDALGGRPGLRSSRYAARGEDPLDKLLDELRGLSMDRRTARFACASVLVGPNEEHHVRHGYMKGFIAESRRGSEGFGFDPIFIPDGFGGEHLAELPAEAKNRISHRARAFVALRPKIEEFILHH